MQLGFRLLGGVVVLGLVLGFSRPAIAEFVINFDDLPEGSVVTNQYPQVTFSSETGFVIRTASSFFEAGNFIGPGPIGSDDFDYMRETILDFASPVRDLKFLGYGISDSGTVALVDVFVNHNLADTVSVIGPGNFEFIPVLVDLSSYSDVTRIRIYNITDNAGIGWDDFRFNRSVVPEPSSLSLGLISMGLILGLAWSSKWSGGVAPTSNSKRRLSYRKIESYK